VKVPVIVDVPALTIVTVPDEMVATLVVPEVNTQLPASDPVTVGAVNANDDPP
jgi:hypothetical protein